MAKLKKKRHIIKVHKKKTKYYNNISFNKIKMMFIEDNAHIILLNRI